MSVSAHTTNTLIIYRHCRFFGWLNSSNAIREKKNKNLSLIYLQSTSSKSLCCDSFALNFTCAILFLFFWFGNKLVFERHIFWLIASFPFFGLLEILMGVYCSDKYTLSEIHKVTRIYTDLENRRIRVSHITVIGSMHHNSG